MSEDPFLYKCKSSNRDSDEAYVVSLQSTSSFNLMKNALIVSDFIYIALIETIKYVFGQLPIDLHCLLISHNYDCRKSIERKCDDLLSLCFYILITVIYDLLMITVWWWFTCLDEFKYNM